MSNRLLHPSPAPAKKTRGQSLIEVSLFMPLLLMMLGGLVEFGFALNQYLNILDAARESARYSSDGDPLSRAACGDSDDDDILDDATVADIASRADDGCGARPIVGAENLPDTTITRTAPITEGGWTLYDGTSDYYIQAAFIAMETVRPVPLDPERDDVVISVFRILSGTIVDRWPNCNPDGAIDCPNDPPTYTPEALGEWHLYGYGGSSSLCGNGVNDDPEDDNVVDDGCGTIPRVGHTIDATCDEDPDALPSCNPSRLQTADMEALLRADAPNSALVAVEVFFSYDQILKLPWITPFVPDPIKMWSYTIAPVPAAEPSLTISGTITETVDNIPVVGVTVDFRAGSATGPSVGIAISDNQGRYSKGGLNSGTYYLLVSKAGSTCQNFVPDPGIVTITTADAVQDFTVQCPTPTPVPPPTLTPSPTDTPEATDTPSPTPTETETPTPSNTPTCPDPDLPVDPALSAFTVLSSSVDADGVETTDLVVTVANGCGVMASQPVTITSSRPSLDTITPATGLTNVGGQFFATIKSAISSELDDVTGVFTPTTLTAQAGAGALFATLDDQPTVQFLCANGIPAGFSSASDIQYYFVNETAEDRALNRVTLTWSSAVGSGREMNNISVYPPTFNIWTGAINTSPAIVSGGWLGTPADRTITLDPDGFNSGAPGGSLFLVIEFNTDLTTIPGSPNNAFVVVTEWRNEADGRVCTSDSITILR